MFRIPSAVVLCLGLMLCSGTGFGGDGPTVLTGGRIEVIDRARLASDQMGVLAREISPEGTRVQAGQVVAELEDDIPKAALAAAEVLASSDADVRAKKNAAELALVELERARFANNRTAGTVPELEVKRLELTYQQALLETERAEKELELNQRRRDQAAAMLQSYRVKVPFSGVITRVMRQRGEAVRQGDPILELVNIDRVRIALEAPLHLREQFFEGMEVQVFLADSPSTSGPNDRSVSLDSSKPRTQGCSGRITFIDPAAEPLSRTVRVHVLVEDNSEQYLTPGLSANVTLIRPAAAP